ncbi:hypothetical protein TNCT_685941 [Trichonephila clavata]|uniref:Uncharacterized protein n=1 Tax=Trichonephila clavata TaxID=2740835 RepID=A0A8X6IC56_TRICU|nr:hypothetical protein TNCT_685941 [Trichonephila clavata]
MPPVLITRRRCFMASIVSQKCKTSKSDAMELYLEEQAFWSRNFNVINTFGIRNGKRIENNCLLTMGAYDSFTALKTIVAH